GVPDLEELPRAGNWSSSWVRAARHLSHRSHRCGKPTRRRTADPPRPHGPCWSWTRNLDRALVTELETRTLSVATGRWTTGRWGGWSARVVRLGGSASTPMRDLATDVTLSQCRLVPIRTLVTGAVLKRGRRSRHGAPATDVGGHGDARAWTPNVAARDTPTSVAGAPLAVPRC